MVETVARKRMSGETFWRSGLLYYVNSTVLWPLGLALAVSMKKSDGKVGNKLEIIQIEPAEVIVSSMADDDDHPRVRVSNWIKSRLAELSEDDRALALEILRDPQNVSAFVPPTSDVS